MVIELDQIVLYCCCYDNSVHYINVLYISLLQLLTVTPQSNSLTLVYKDSDTLSFTKYINHRAEVPSNSMWYTVMTVYKENTVEVN